MRVEHGEITKPHDLVRTDTEIWTLTAGPVICLIAVRELFTNLHILLRERQDLCWKCIS